MLKLMSKKIFTILCSKFCLSKPVCTSIKGNEGWVWQQCPGSQACQTVYCIDHQTKCDGPYLRIEMQIF